MHKTRFHKKGIGLVVEIVLILAIAVLFVAFISPEINRGAQASINPLKKLLGEQQSDTERQKEMERVSKELLASAVNVYSQFASVISKCQGIADNCICGTIDFTKLNDYYLKLTKEGRNQFLEFLDSNKVPVNEKYRISLGSFGVGSKDSPSNEPGNFKYLLFSKDSIAYNKDNSNTENLKNRMNKVNILQSTSNTIFFDDLRSGLHDCSANGASFAYIKQR